MDRKLDIVHTVTDWYDGPRSGIADYQGSPYLYQSEYLDTSPSDMDAFLLIPIDQDVFQLALEDWAIWRRWEIAFHSGETAPETHPVLPEDRKRHEELQRLLDGRLVIDPNRAVRKAAKFQDRNDPVWNDYPLTVCWLDIP